MTIALAQRIDISSGLSLQQRALGAYIGHAVGDALGSTTEFMTPNEIRHQYGLHDKMIGGGWLKLKPGQVTDDTEMSLALDNSILQNAGVLPEKVAESFSQWMRNKPIDIGNTVRRGIIHFRSSGSASVEVNEYDAGNGACMRTLPLVIFYHDSPLELLIQASRAQSHVTHNNPVADAGTETVLQMLLAALHNQSLNSLKTLAAKLVSQDPVYRFDRRRVENPGGYIVETLQAVFQALFSNSCFRTTLVDVVNRGGDADTTGAIAGMLSGMFYGVDDIPADWTNSLDQTVKKACEQQALDLLDAARQ